MMQRVGRAIGFGMVVVLVFAAGCASQTIQSDELYKEQPGFSISEEAEIRDNTKNRQVLDVVAQYRNAIANKDFGALERIVSDDYYENAGTTDTTRDDYGKDKLKEIFELMAEHADQIQYDVVVESISYDNNRALVDVEYEYAYKYQLDDKPSWDAGVEVNQLELVPDGDSWKIVSGL